MIKIGIIGIGRLGVQHLERLLISPYFKVIGCFDKEQHKLKPIQEEYGVDCFDDVDELINKCDAVEILTPSDSHYYYAEKAIRFGKHVYVDKPISNSADEAKKLVELIREAGIIFQVGHTERYNPVFLALKQQSIQPLFIESPRLSLFDAKRTNDSIIMDVMIHDLDIILSIVKANIKSISASGVSVLSDQIDIANARIEFDNACVANLTASRTSVQKMRKMLFFQKDSHITLDFLNREAELLHLSETAKHNAIPMHIQETTRYINTETMVTEEYDALKEELNSFAECLLFNKEPNVTALDSLKSIEVASEILQKIQKMNSHLELSKLPVNTMVG
ncbi:MAG TPA: Gfo/Idh/MocA family oxidoreductase [Chitinophagales bacterium]|nr:Gfo/Idh/MocA family oxidoreductase [Chitinophagales bacterium]